MILPTKHIRPDRSLLGVGAQVLEMLESPMTMSKLWDEFRSRRSGTGRDAPIGYRWFVLAVDLLYIIKALELKRGLLVKASI